MKDKLVVVVGAGGKLGRLIVRSLLEHPEVRVRALVRDPRKLDDAGWPADRVEAMAFDAVSSTAAAREDAMRPAFSVISALQGGPDIIIDAQLALVRAAKAAGARRFIASDYSFDFFTLSEGINVAADWRRQLAIRAREENSGAFELVHVLNGMFLDRNVFSFLEIFDAEKRILRYWGEGTTPIDLTTWEDTAAFTAEAALDEDRVPERLSVSGGRMDIFTLAKTWEAVHGKSLTLERLGSLDDLARETRRRLDADPRNPLSWLPMMYARGVFGGEALLSENHNARYPSVRPTSIADGIARGAL
ncbi:NmrA family NAD(P)-binding protein [Labilithrix luteola]|nr:NmrA family NAD(P)-binding protein [Labilithrix luteola]